MRTVTLSFAVALLAAMSSANADGRLWREQVKANASETIAVNVSAGERASTTPGYLWREQLDASHVRVVLRGNAAALDYALWREQLASRVVANDATRVAGR
jgi:hypothetical protein